MLTLEASADPLLFSAHALRGSKPAALSDHSDRAGAVRDVLLRLTANPDLTIKITISAIATVARNSNFPAGDLARFLGSLPKSSTALRLHLAERASAAHGYFSPAVRRSFDPAEIAALLGLAAADEIAAEVLAGAALVRGSVVAVLRPGGADHFSAWTVSRATAPPDLRGANAAQAFAEMIRWSFTHLPIRQLGAHIPSANRPACRMAVAAGFTHYASTAEHRHYIARKL